MLYSPVTPPDASAIPEKQTPARRDGLQKTLQFKWGVLKYSDQGLSSISFGLQFSNISLIGEAPTDFSDAISSAISPPSIACPLAPTKHDETSLPLQAGWLDAQPLMAVIHRRPRQ
jgi:hypothetical protein